MDSLRSPASQSRRTHRCARSVNGDEDDGCRKGGQRDLWIFDRSCRCSFTERCHGNSHHSPRIHALGKSNRAVCVFESGCSRANRQELFNVLTSASILETIYAGDGYQNGSNGSRCETSIVTILVSILVLPSRYESQEIRPRNECVDPPILAIPKRPHEYRSYRNFRRS